MEETVVLNVGQMKITGVKEEIPIKIGETKGDWLKGHLFLKDLEPNKRTRAIKYLNKIGMRVEFLDGNHNTAKFSINVKNPQPKNKIRVIGHKITVHTNNPQQIENQARLEFLNSGKLPENIINKL